MGHRSAIEIEDLPAAPEWRVELPPRPLSPEEWCQLASDLRGGMRRADACDRVAITIEMDDGATLTFEHDESVRDLE